MRCRASAALLCCIIAAGTVAAPDDGAADWSLEEIAPGVHVHHGRHVDLEHPARGDSANLSFVVGSRCVAVIDSGGSLATGRALRAAIARTTPLPVCYVINTHAHFDHVLGNAAFSADEPVFVGHANLAAALDASRDYFGERFAAELDGSAVVGPGLLVDDATTLDLGGRSLELTAVGDAHSVADLIVRDSASDTLFGGDLVFMERLPVLDGSLRGWLAWIEAAVARPATRVVPGHGPVSAPWPAALEAERAYLETLLETARAAVADGAFLEDLTAAADAAPPAGWLLTGPHARNTGKAFREVEWE